MLLEFKLSGNEIFVTAFYIVLEFDELGKQMTPDKCVMGARVLLSALFLTVAGVIVATNLRPDLDLGSTNPFAHFTVFYLISLIAFVGFPRVRRTDVVTSVGLFAGGMELLRLSFGQGAPLQMWVLDLAAAAAVYLPSEIEHLRQLARTSGYLRFSDIAANDRRQLAGRRRVQLGSQNRSSI